MEDKKRLYLSDSDKKICGVCGGIADYFNVDSTLIRIIVILLMFITAILPVTIFYFIASAVMPERPKEK